MVATYRKKPATVEAMQWTGENIQELWDWVTAEVLYGPVPAEGQKPATPARLWVEANHAWLDIETSEWILKDKLGFYPCKNVVFRESYEFLVGAIGSSDRRSHSRACGLVFHQHGTYCSIDCPTCGGK